jgi:ubiquinone/menaquinone biosynthesis C-methylase UbiE
MRIYNQLTANRKAGLWHERRFWRRYFQTKGLAWPEEYARRLDPNTQLSEQLCALLAHIPKGKVLILDVGAGPFTELGKQHPSKKLTIVATDVLAREYDALLQRYNIQPPVRTMYANAERLDEIFVENAFDLCVARNCVDHMANPLQAILQMLRVVKKGCYVVLSHAENEADARNYRGLHQWNFTVVNGDFIMESRSQYINISQIIRPLGCLECHAENGWVDVLIRKV